MLNSLSKLSPSKSSGCPLLTNRVLREVAPSISQSLTYIFNLSLHSSTFPQDWKTAVVVPLYKQRGDASAPTNYRPVSLLPAVAKVLDAIQSKRLSSFLLKNKLLTDHQFGFLPGRSTTQQLVYVVDKWLQTQDKGSASVGVFLDFQKAFDKVWHKGLLFKLACCGVSPDALSWFESYLFDRAITVRVEGIYSKSHPISTGVPQGSHLGPILFAVFINDLTSAVQKSQTDCTRMMLSSTRISPKTTFRKKCTVSRQAYRMHLLGPSPGEAVSLPPRPLFFRLATLPQTHVSNSLCLLMRKISTS